MIAKIEPLTTTRALRGPFDYRLPERLAGVGVGDVLAVPFAGRRMLGVVTDLAERSELPPERLAEPHGAVEGGVPEGLVRLGLWIAREYCSTPARGLALVLPPGTGTGARGQRVRARRELVAELTAAGRAAAGDAAVAAEPGAGPAPVGAETPGAGYRPLGPRQAAALAALAAAGGPLPVTALRERTGADHSTLRALERRGLVALERRQRRRRPDFAGVGAAATGAERLTPAQQGALEAIEAAFDAREPEDRRLLLHGVTGSGKTEVYLRAVARALERGRSAIVLVPEIALTPQTVARFERRFGDLVAVLHSKLGQGERFDEWIRLRDGEARVCVGPRSAIFAPLADVGLIVVDEEHDPSYKQDGDPRYDARRVAERRAADAGAVLLCGTATPRPESWQRLRRVRMPERVDGRALPPVELVAMRGVSSALHARTLEALDEVRRRRGKAIVLLNRRGWSNFLTCRACGRVWGCRECDVSLVLHRAQGRLACHHCGHAERVPHACPDCGSVSLARHGAGTERLEHELEQLLAPFPVLRLDSDAAAGRGAILDLLRRFEQAPAGVLVGTQMVAKGHDFPDVTLGVVLDADATLRFPDFRAEERTFALVAQLAGRSGRGPRGGRVVVQALDPDARSLRHAARHDADGFLADELDRRSALAYPPFAHLIRVVCLSPEPGPELAAAQAVRERIATVDASVLGPAPLFRLKGRERAQLVVKAFARRPAIEAVGRAVEAISADKQHRGVSFAVDVDPQ